MPVLTQDQIEKLLARYASGITEVEVPGGERIRYADPMTMRKILADVEGDDTPSGGFYTLATFNRDR